MNYVVRKTIKCPTICCNSYILGTIIYSGEDINKSYQHAQMLNTSYMSECSCRCDVFEAED